MSNKIAVNVHDLKSGMYVEELDRPWLETPYLFEGISIDSQADVDELARHCKFVYVTATPQTLALKPYGDKKELIPEESPQRTEFDGTNFYEDTSTVEEELPVAKQAQETAHILIDQIKQDIDKDLSLNANIAKELVGVISNSMVKNPQAMLLLNQFKSTLSNQYERALSVSIYMIAFGRHLCLPVEELSILGLGGLLMDIGKIKLLSKGEVERKGLLGNNKIEEKHVELGESILKEMPGIPDKVLEIVAQHHERDDMSGYPRGLSGNQISAYARMASIVDCYEKLITEGLYEDSAPLSPFEALNMLWDWTRRWLNPVLVQRFAHCIGLFPVGSLIELNSGEVAIVQSHNRSNRLKPKVMVVLDQDKKPYGTPKTVDLSQTGSPYEIAGDFKSEDWNVVDLKKYYL